MRARARESLGAERARREVALAQEAEPAASLAENDPSAHSTPPSSPLVGGRDQVLSEGWHPPAAGAEDEAEILSESTTYYSPYPEATTHAPTDPPMDAPEDPAYDAPVLGC